ncbi:hypothetical protein G9A89_019460 [Geosiphon pyriformis]|nr:hypothetical protein G9A89_019460 [Geosiphon pyriformis]
MAQPRTKGNFVPSFSSQSHQRTSKILRNSLINETAYQNIRKEIKSNLAEKEGPGKVLRGATRVAELIAYSIQALQQQQIQYIRGSYPGQVALLDSFKNESLILDIRTEEKQEKKQKKEHAWYLNMKNVEDGNLAESCARVRFDRKQPNHRPQLLVEIDVKVHEEIVRDLEYEQEKHVEEINKEVEAERENIVEAVQRDSREKNDEIILLESSVDDSNSFRENIEPEFQSSSSMGAVRKPNVLEDEVCTGKCGHPEKCTKWIYPFSDDQVDQNVSNIGINILGNPMHSSILPGKIPINTVADQKSLIDPPISKPICESNQDMINDKVKLSSAITIRPTLSASEKVDSSQIKNGLIKNEKASLNTARVIKGSSEMFKKEVSKFNNTAVANGVGGKGKRKIEDV